MENVLKKVKTSPKDFFLWVGVMATLYLSSISLLILLFEYIKILFPDELDYYVDPYRGAIRFAIASLIVIFPLYIFLTRLVNQDIRKHKAKQDLAVRKWMVYLTLFVAGVTLVIDLIVLINFFLGGELTTQFILKILSVIIVIGGVFLYYFYDLKGYWRDNESKSKLYGAVVSLVIIASVVGGFFIMGSPADQRLLRFDQEKVNDLSSIQWQIINYWQSKEEIPESLDELEEPLSGFAVPTDPQTDEPYGYEKTGARTFNLCATFNKESFNLANDTTYRPKFGFDQANWEHEAGDICFERDIDPDLYPPYREI